MGDDTFLSLFLFSFFILVICSIFNMQSFFRPYMVVCNVMLTSEWMGLRLQAGLL